MASQSMQLTERVPRAVSAPDEYPGGLVDERYRAQARVRVLVWDREVTIEGQQPGGRLRIQPRSAARSANAPAASTPTATPTLGFGDLPNLYRTATEFRTFNRVSTTASAWGLPRA